MKRNVLLLGGILIALFASSCKKDDGEDYPKRTNGKISFLQEEITVQVDPTSSSVDILSVPLRLTRRDSSQSLTANVQCGWNTTAVFGKQFMLFSVTDNDRLEWCHAVAEFARYDSLAFFPVMLMPEQITEPKNIELILYNAYYSEYQDDEVIHSLNIRLEPAKAEKE